MSVATIYSFPTFNLTKIMLTAEELGMDYNLKLMDLSQGEHKTPEHLARHPLGKVPAVEIDGRAFFESNCICRLFAELNNNQLYGNTPEERALVNQWVDMMAFHMGRWLTVFFYEEKVKKLFNGGDADSGLIAEAQKFLNAQLPSMEQQLSRHAFLAGNDITIADIIGFSYFTTAELTSIDLSGYPHITNWYNSIRARPTYDKVMKQLPGEDMLSVFND